MVPRHWDGTGPEFHIGWGGRVWTLRPDAARPGLYSEGYGPLLGLGGVAAAGRLDPAALTGATLAECSARFDHVEAIYKPPAWGDLTVRAVWGPAAVDDALDLLVEVSAQSVGDLKAVEVLTLSSLEPPNPASSATHAQRSILPRDEPSALLARDGREGDPAGWIVETPPADGGMPPWTMRRPAIGEDTYVALAHPDDVSRRIVDATGQTVHHALFGYDLERGVVLRGRLRALWCPGSEAEAASVAEAALARILREPLPLTT